VTDHNFASMRAAMVDSQLRTNSVSDPRIVAAMQAVAREDFVPADRAALAYVDVPLSLGGGRCLNAPLVTGRLIVEAAIKTNDHVLLIGAATGYAAAVIAQLAATVVAVESDPALAAHARKALEAYDNVSVCESSLVEGNQAGAPFDVIIIEGAVEGVPAALWGQLRPGGVMVAALADDGVNRLARGQQVDGSGVLLPFADCDVAPLPGFSTPRGFTF
jgi:protein-L-isoaspartate(D-aspartate) O-methyltransferase